MISAETWRTVRYSRAQGWGIRGIAGKSMLSAIAVGAGGGPGSGFFRLPRGLASWRIPHGKASESSG